MGGPSPLGPNRGPRFMGLPKIMPPTAVGSLQTGLRKGFPAPVDLLRRVLSGGGGDGAASGVYDSARLGESGFSKSTAPADSRTDPPAASDSATAVEHRRQSPAGGRRRHAAATAGRDRSSVRPVSAFLLILLRGYKVLISPWLPSACRFHPTCSCYMREAIVAHGAAHGVWLGVRRLLKCHPWNKGGVDYVPLHRTELHGR